MLIKSCVVRLLVVNTQGLSSVVVLKGELRVRISDLHLSVVVITLPIRYSAVACLSALKVRINELYFCVAAGGKTYKHQYCKNKC